MTTTNGATWDPEKFRLRNLAAKFEAIGELEVRDEQVDLSDLSRVIEATPKAVLFRKAGPENTELIAAVSGSRKRLAAAIGVPEPQAREELQRRVANPKKAFRVSAGEAPVQQVVLTGADVDLTKLPFHVQHEWDGAPYISSGIDYTIDPLTGRSNVGSRRLMLRGKDRCGVNVTAPSDLRAMYLGCVERGERLPISLTIGAHPMDLMAATTRGAPGDEINRVGTFRGEDVAVVKCVTNDIYVPADAEVVLEGYFDERGYVEEEGPYGEYMGFYGPVHGDPVFHCTAITRRRDALYQTIKHGVGRKLAECDSVPMRQVLLEAEILTLLRQAGLAPTDVHIPGGPGASGHIRVAIRKNSDADARGAIAIILGAVRTAKHVFVVDPDIDIRSDTEMEWAMSARFQADKDIVVLSNMRVMPMDPSAPSRGIGAKAGFDMTFSIHRKQGVTSRVPEAPVIKGPARYQNARQAIEAKPMRFAEIMAAVGSRDGREVVLEIERLREDGLVRRNEDGEYYVKG